MNDTTPRATARPITCSTVEATPSPGYTVGATTATRFALPASRTSPTTLITSVLTVSLGHTARTACEKPPDSAGCEVSRVNASPYAGGNETIDRLHDGTTDIWIVNGVKGRKVLLLPPGCSEEEAITTYKERYGTTYFDTTGDEIEEEEDSFLQQVQ